MAVTINGTTGIETNTDTGKIKFGTDDDLQIYHSGSAATIKNITGNLNITNTGNNTIVNSDNITFQSGDQGETLARFIDDGTCELWHNNTKRFETYSNGTLSTGNMKCTGSVYVGNQVDGHDGNSTGQLMFGAGNDLKIWHDGTTNIIEGLDSNMSIRPKAGENGILLRNNGAVELYYDDTKRLETSDTGVNVAGYLFVERADHVATFDMATSTDVDGIRMRHRRGGLSGYAGKMISFRGNDNTEEGSIVIGTTTTAYNTSSDYRLKENQVAISDGITRLKTLKPYRFNFIKDPDVTVDGFFAHEVTAVPEAITGEKDKVITQSQVDDGSREEADLGKPEYQQIDQSKLVPLLTAALQEAITKIETLETKVAALEAA